MLSYFLRKVYENNKKIKVLEHILVINFDFLNVKRLNQKTNILPGYFPK